MKLKSLLAVIALSTASTAVPAAVVRTFTGDTTGGATFNRLLEDLSDSSLVGTNVRYQDYEFTVSAAGEYSFLTTGVFDTFVFLYSPTFDPLSPKINALKGDDDLVNTWTSGFAADLLANTRYHYIVTGFANTDFGAWSTTVGGPGAVTPVPLPAAAWLLISGLGVVAMRVRRRTADASAAA